jgi:hypothetical protein
MTTKDNDDIQKALGGSIILPDFKPLPDISNISNNYVSAFNTGMNIYQCLNYLQGYTQLNYEGLKQLIEDLKEYKKALEQYIDELEEKLENEIKAEAEARKEADDAESKARKDADDAESKARQDADTSLEDKKVNRSGDTMTGDLNAPNVVLSGAVRTSTGSGNPAILAGYSSKVEAGTSARAFNINGSGVRPTYNSSNQLALLSDIVSGEGDTSTYFKEYTSSEMPVLSTSTTLIPLPDINVTDYDYMIADVVLSASTAAPTIRFQYVFKLTNVAAGNTYKTGVYTSNHTDDSAGNRSFVSYFITVGYQYTGTNQIGMTAVNSYNIGYRYPTEGTDHPITLNMYMDSISARVANLLFIKAGNHTAISTATADETQEEPTTGDTESISAETSENSTEETTGTTSKDEAKAKAETEKIQKKTEEKETSKQTEPTQSNEPTL